LTWGTQNNAGSAKRVSASAPTQRAEAGRGRAEDMGSSSSAAAASAVRPEDDICSVCHDHFRIPCHANCSHWFYGKSLLLFFLSLPGPAVPLFSLGRFGCSFPSLDPTAWREIEPVGPCDRLRRTVSYSVQNRFGAGCLFSFPCRRVGFVRVVKNSWVC
jgi:hypothetical protein